MDPQEFLRGVNTFEAEYKDLQDEVMKALRSAQQRGEKAFSVALGDVPGVVWQAVQNEWIAVGWVVTHDNFRNEGTLNFKPNA